MKAPKAAKLNYNEIIVGAEYQFTKKIHRQLVLDFAQLTGDYSPLHTDLEFGKTCSFRQNVVHGMLLGSLFSTLVGMYCPGERCLYISQSLNFKKPIFYEDTVIVKGTVLSKTDSIQLVTMKTEIIKHSEIAINGEARIQC